MFESRSRRLSAFFSGHSGRLFASRVPLLVGSATVEPYGTIRIVSKYRAAAARTAHAHAGRSGRAGGSVVSSPTVAWAPLM